jgi:hypothetical protein
LNLLYQSVFEATIATLIQFISGVADRPQAVVDAWPCGGDRTSAVTPPVSPRRAQRRHESVAPPLTPSISLLHSSVRAERNRGRRAPPSPRALVTAPPPTKPCPSLRHTALHLLDQPVASIEPEVSRIATSACSKCHRSSTVFRDTMASTAP